MICSDMMNKLLLSFVVPVYDKEDVLERTLNSIFVQSSTIMKSSLLMMDLKMGV